MPGQSTQYTLNMMTGEMIPTPVPLDKHQMAILNTGGAIYTGFVGIPGDTENTEQGYASKDIIINTNGEVFRCVAADATTATWLNTTLTIDELGALATMNSINNDNWDGADLSILNGGTGASDAPTAFTNLKQVASTTATGVVELATDGEAVAEKVVQGNDARMANARTPTPHDNTKHTTNYEAEGVAANAVSTHNTETEVHGAGIGDSVQLLSERYTDTEARVAIANVSDLGTVTGVVIVDAAAAPYQTLTVGVVGVTDIAPTNLAAYQVTIRVDNSGGYSFAMPMATCIGTVYKLGEIPTSGIFDIHLQAIGNDWYATISNDWVI